MDGENKVWATLILAIMVIATSAIGLAVVANTNNHNFDKKCVESGNNLTFITVEGEDYAKKVCLKEAK